MSDASESPSPELIERIRAVRLLVFDFDGVFTDNGVYVFEDGREAVRCNRSDGIGLSRLRALETVQTIVVSTEVNQVVDRRCKKLKIECIHGVQDKVARMEELLAARELTWDQTAYVGNDVNDAGCLERVGLAIVVQDAHPDVLDLGFLRTTLTGGHGAVREVCDLFVRVLKS